MSDRKQNSTSANDSEFDRDLAVTSKAYKNAGVDTPTAAIDDAIRAAARRGVKSQPHATGKSWSSRWSTPLSAAALVVLSVSVGFLAIDERPELAPAPLKQAVGAKSAASPLAPAMPLNAPESAAAAAATAPRLSQPAPATEKKARVDRQNESPRDQLADSAKPDLERRRNEADGAALATVLPKDERDAVAVNAPSAAGSIASASAPAATPKSVAKESQAFASDPPAAGAAPRQGNVVAATETTKREVAQDNQVTRQLDYAGVTARGDAPPAARKSQATVPAPAAALAPTIASRTAISPPLHAAAPTAQSPANNADEPAEVWMKRILELKQQGKTREFEEELAKFRKRFPDFRLPEALRERR